MKYGCQSMVGKIKNILIKHPRNAFIDQNNINTHWKELNYLDCVDYERALKEYDYFEELLREHVPEVHYLPRNDRCGLDSIYAHDSVVITKKGVIICNMGKSQRRSEPSASGLFLNGLGVPTLGRVSGDGLVESGDLVWIDERTLAVGEGYRTNKEGILQLREILGDLIDELIVVPLPHWLGPKSVLHLMSLISFIDENLALVYSRLLAVPFREWLLSRGIKLIEVDDSEYKTMGCLVLMVSPRKCIMVSGNPKTQQILTNEGVEVWEYEGEEISLKGGGGPTCLTRPILRE